jgi:FixJ family two-component response regulator
LSSDLLKETPKRAILSLAMAMQAGVVDFLRKPFSGQALKSAIQSKVQ